MQKFLTNAQMRAADSYTINTLGVPSLTLMERAGGAIAGYAKQAAEGGKKVVVVCGGGNNGGDGYVCARLLNEWNIAVSVFDASNGKYSPDCAAQRAVYKGAYTQNVASDVIVDCIFGTGLCRTVEGRYADIINAINQSGAYVISADIPSGLNGDNGLALGTAVRADLTVAVAQYKLGHVLGDGPDYCGAVVRADIGISAAEDCAYAMDDSEIAPFFPQRKHNSHKGTYGSACLVAGSQQYPGAAALCLSTALRSGCGYVKLCADDGVKIALAAAYPQAIYLSAPDYSSSALAVGPGCGDGVLPVLKDIFANYGGKLIIDADGLNAIARVGANILKSAKAQILITPHAKEFSRLTGLSVNDILADPAGYARKFAKENKVIVLLKGAATVITDGDRVVLNLRGSTALAKGGSGDMLTGFICGTAARGVDLFDAAVCSAYVLGCAAEGVSSQKTDYCGCAQDIIAELPNAIKNIASADCV